MGVQANPYPLRIDKVVMQKAKVISAYNGRSLNKEIEMLIKRAISDFEKEKGEIIIPKDLDE